MAYILLAGLPYLASVGEVPSLKETWRVGGGEGVYPGGTSSAQRRKGQKDEGRIVGGGQWAGRKVHKLKKLI